MITERAQPPYSVGRACRVPEHPSTTSGNVGHDPFATAMRISGPRVTSRRRRCPRWLT